MDVARERISRIFELREMLLSFQAGFNLVNTAVVCFQRVDIGSDSDLLSMTFHLHLKRISKPKHTRLKFNLEKRKDPSVL